MPRKVPVLAATAMAVGALAIGSLPAAAEPSPPGQSPTGDTAPAPEVAPGMLKSISRDLGITTSQARTRLVNERKAAAVEKSLRERLGSRYGGAWVTGSTSKLTVATTDRRDTRVITAAGAAAEVVAHSLAELEAAKQALDRTALKRTPRATSVWAVDVQSNSVLVRAGQPAAAKDFLTRSGAAPELVRVTQSAERPRLYAEDLRGGEAYYSNGSTRCSIGFAVTKGGKDGFLTAGHCGKAGAKTTGHNRAAQGTVRARSFPGNDYGWVEADSGWRATPYVKGTGGANVTVSGSQQMPPGSSVCRSGSTSGWRCGTIEQHGATITYEEGTVEGLTRSTVCAEPGDSGGPFISSDQAQGTTSGGSGDCSLGGTTYYQPVSEPLKKYGLTLKTG
ncbi:serine protease [Streptomyces daqingensis]|uniref:Serine protease n=1 Tax=Streptomyces daqingensis TaxID=1472640 RepID=A0ABQ2LVX6_9ACTN|nr:S1 family peptidase [Streptomyces daqingensis]GGO43994.1 serine protease [Streptomyces daqingensis]